MSGLTRNADEALWITRQGSPVAGPFHAYGGLRAWRPGGWKDSAKALCGVALHCPITVAGETRRRALGEPIDLVPFEWESGSEATCARCERKWRARREEGAA